MAYCYDYPHFAITTDIVIFKPHDGSLQLLLIYRGGDPFKHCWALPGGFVDAGESLDACATRELAEETGISGIPLQQFHTYGHPLRDPRERVISVAYFALILNHVVVPIAGSDAHDVNWFPVDALPKLAFDHSDIVQMALRHLPNCNNIA